MLLSLREMRNIAETNQNEIVRAPTQATKHQMQGAATKWIGLLPNG